MALLTRRGRALPLPPRVASKRPNPKNSDKNALHNIQLKYNTLIYKQILHLKSRLLVGGFFSWLLPVFSPDLRAFFSPRISPRHWRGWQKRLGQGGDVDPEFFGQ